jgi:hypothetical protein
MRLKTRPTFEIAEGAEILAPNWGSAAIENSVSAPSAISVFTFRLRKTLRLSPRLGVSAVNITSSSD